MKEELTEKMHSEFTISNEIEIKHRVGIVCEILKATGNYTEDDLNKVLQEYNVSKEQYEEWKSFWERLMNYS